MIIKSGLLYVPGYAPTGNPGEYTFSDAKYENQSDFSNTGAFNVQVGHVLYVPAFELNSGMPIPGVAHRYKITSIDHVTINELSATVVWDEKGEEQDRPLNGSYAVISESTENFRLGLPASSEVYDKIPGGISDYAGNLNFRDIIDNLISAAEGIHNHIVNEVPDEDLDGVRREFLLKDILIPGTTQVYLNGLRLMESQDYVENAASIIFRTPPDEDDFIIIDYVTPYVDPD